MADQPQAWQQVTAGNNAYVAGRDLVINDGTGVAELGVPGLLPRDVPAFTGRDAELARLAAQAGGGRVVVSAIGGTAGVGKTALAVHAAHRLLPLFPDGHLYADLRGYTEGQGPAGPGEVLQVFLRRLGVPAEEIPAELEERSGLLRQVLASRRVLMVVDNARTEAQVRPLLPGAGGSLVMVTSRSVLPGLEVDARISLDVLPGSEAAAMLAEVIGAARADAEPQAVAEVARLCGRLPLALRIAGQLLATHPAWPVARLAQMLASEQDRLGRLGAGDLQVRAAFEVSYRQLAEEDARLFRLLGLHPGPDFNAGSSAALAGIEEASAALVLDRLAGVHLIAEDATGRFFMHDLLRLYARQLSGDDAGEREQATDRLLDYYLNSANAADDHLRALAGAPLPAEFTGRDDALAWLDAERLNLIGAVAMAAVTGRGQIAVRLPLILGTYLSWRRRFDDWLTVLAVSRDFARRQGNRAHEAMALTQLGIALREARRFEEAIRAHQDAVAIHRETGDRHREGRALNNLGAALREAGQCEEAISAHQDAVAISQGIGDRHGEGMALGNLGAALQQVRRFEEAIRVHRDAVAIHRETGDRHGEGMALSNLGLALREVGQCEEAISAHQEDLAICRETGDRHGEGMALGNLGAALQQVRRFEEAISAHQDAVAIYGETGDRHREGITLNNLGLALQQVRRFEEAISAHQDAVAIFREAGDRHREGMALKNLESARSAVRRLSAPSSGADSSTPPGRSGAALTASPSM